MTSENPDRRSASPGSGLRSLTPRLPTIGEEIIDAGELSSTDIVSRTAGVDTFVLAMTYTNGIVKSIPFTVICLMRIAQLFQTMYQTTRSRIIDAIFMLYVYRVYIIVFISIFIM